MLAGMVRKMSDRRKGERRSFTWDNPRSMMIERRKTIIKAGRRIKDRRSEDNYFCHKERRKK